MGTKALFFDHAGNTVQEIGGIFRRSWKLNAVDKCVFSFRNLDPKTKQSTFEFGNYIVLFNDGGLPSWGGRYDPDRSWGLYTFSNTAYSMEDAFNQRGGKPSSAPTILTGPAGVAFRTLITVANEQEDMLLRAGEIYEGGKNTSIEVSPLISLMSDIDGLVKQSRQDWGIEPNVVDNKLSFNANWYLKRGRLLEKGLNDKNCELSEESVKETGQIFNQIVGYGTGDTFVERPKYTARDEASIKRYGLRSKPYSVNSDVPATVQAATERELARLAWPRKTYKARVRYTPENCKLLRLGNILPFENPKAGFNTASGKRGSQGYVRLMAMAYQDGDRNVEVTIQDEVVTV